MEGVSVAKIAKKMDLKNFTDEINLKDHTILISDVNRPALQLNGFFEHFEQSMILPVQIQHFRLPGSRLLRCL